MGKRRREQLLGSEEERVLNARIREEIDRRVEHRVFLRKVQGFETKEEDRKLIVSEITRKVNAEYAG